MVLPLPAMVPVPALPLAMPSTVQATAVLDEPETVAVKEVEAPAFKLVEVGFNVTVTTGGGATTVMAEEAD